MICAVALSSLHPHTVPHPNQPTLYHPRGNPPVAAHGVVAAGAEAIFHQRAGVAVAGVFQHRVADAEAFVFQRQQIDAADDDIAPGQSRIDGATAQERADRGQVFGLNERHLALALVAPPSKAIPHQPVAGHSFGPIHRFHRLSMAGSQTDPQDFAGLGQGVQEGLYRAIFGHFNSSTRRKLTACVTLCVFPNPIPLENA